MTEVTRGEFDMLKSQVADQGRRMESIDMSGTRGWGVIQQQLTDLSKDVATLAKQVDDHENQHQVAERSRLVARRWLITTMVAVLAMIEVPLLYLVTQH